MCKHICADCGWLRQTSPDQVFLLCDRHARFDGGLVNRCHVQPWAPACEYFAKREPGSAVLGGIDIMALPLVAKRRVVA